MIGRWGPVKFFVHRNRVLTFDGLALKQGMKIAEHDAPYWKGRLEVTGEELDEATLKVTLLAELGVRPRAQYERIRAAMHRKEVHYLIIGNKRMMDSRCIITSISSGWEHILSNGKVAEIDLNITFKEYT